MSIAHREHDPAPAEPAVVGEASKQGDACLPVAAVASHLTEAERQRRREELADEIRHGRLDVPALSSEEFDALRREMWIREP